MKPIYLLIALIGCSNFALTTRGADRKPNVLLICVDDLRPELACFGASYIKSPNIDRLASSGRIFRGHYVQAPTCGASRYTLLTGRYGGATNDALFQRAVKLKSQPDLVSASMPAWFRQHGYTTVSVGKVSHHPGGLGGKDWDDDDRLEMPEAWDRHLLPAGSWKHPRGWMHGLADDLTKTPQPSFSRGVSLRPILDDPMSPGHAAISYNPKGETIRTPTHRLIRHHDGFIELYDQSTNPSDSKNIAGANLELVNQLTRQLEDRLGR